MFTFNKRRISYRNRSKGYKRMFFKCDENRWALCNPFHKIPEGGCLSVILARYHYPAGSMCYLTDRKYLTSQTEWILFNHLITPRAKTE